MVRWIAPAYEVVARVRSVWERNDEVDQLFRGGDLFLSFEPILVQRERVLDARRLANEVELQRTPVSIECEEKKGRRNSSERAWHAFFLPRTAHSAPSSCSTIPPIRGRTVSNNGPTGSSAHSDLPSLSPAKLPGFHFGEHAVGDEATKRC